MTSDAERREVARRLRHSWANVPDKNPARHQLRVLFEIYSAVGLADDDDADAIDLFDRLADLIEPDHGVDSDKMVDRDALLEMADEMEFDGAGALDDEDWCKPLLVEYASRIREALGVTDG